MLGTFNSVLCILCLSNTILISLILGNCFHLTDFCQGCTNQIDKYEREVQDLRRQLELANEKINELEVSIPIYYRRIIHTSVRMKIVSQKSSNKIV